MSYHAGPEDVLKGGVEIAALLYEGVQVQLPSGHRQGIRRPVLKIDI